MKLGKHPNQKIKILKKEGGNEKVEKKGKNS